MAKKKNKTIEANPLTDYLSPQAKPKQTKPATKTVETLDEKALKQRVTIHISVDLIDKVKNAVYWEPGLTLTEFAERAFLRELKKWEKDWGEEYPQRQDYQLKGGRPLK
ncbi:MAG: hypothetical protein WD055_05390 [Candidatus Dependentiae bacterium]